MTAKFEIFDCGCARGRPKESRLYGARWRVYLTVNYVILRCLDCNKSQRFALQKETVQISQYGITENMRRAESCTGVPMM